MAPPTGDPLPIFTVVFLYRKFPFTNIGGLVAAGPDGFWMDRTQALGIYKRNIKSPKLEAVPAPPAVSLESYGRLCCVTAASPLIMPQRLHAACKQ